MESLLSVLGSFIETARTTGLAWFRRHRVYMPLVVLLALIPGCGDGEPVVPDVPAVPACYSLSPPALDFGRVALGDMSELDCLLFNGTGHTLAVNAIEDHGVFRVHGCDNVSVANGETLAIAIEFAPTSPGPHSLELRFGEDYACPALTCVGQGATGTIRGVVYDAAVGRSAVLSNQTVFSIGDLDSSWTLTNERGEFLFAEVPPGLIDVEVRKEPHSCYESWTDWTEIEADSVAFVEIGLELTDENEPNDSFDDATYLDDAQPVTGYLHFVTATTIRFPERPLYDVDVFELAIDEEGTATLSTGALPVACEFTLYRTDDEGNFDERAWTSGGRDGTSLLGLKRFREADLDYSWFLVVEPKRGATPGAYDTFPFETAMDFEPAEQPLW